MVTRILCTDPDVKAWGSIAEKEIDMDMSFIFKRLVTDDFHKIEHDKIAWKHDSGMGTPKSLEVISGKIRKGGYSIFWIFSIRRPGKFELRGYNQSLIEHMKGVKREDQYVIWDCSLMFLDADNYLKEMGMVLDLDLSKAEEIKNPDEKWIKVHVEH